MEKETRMSSRRSNLIIRCSLIVLSASILVACGESTTNPTGEASGMNQSPSIVATYPGDGQTGVSTSSGVTVAFNTPMDTLSVEQQLYIAGGPAMNEWNDSLDHYRAMGGMGMGGGQAGYMTYMMNWLDTIRSSGTFHWNSAHDSCRFVPDSSLGANEDYIIFLYGNIDSQGGKAMDMSNYPYDAFIVRFHTGQ